jgi:hypothetical protein
MVRAYSRVLPDDNPDYCPRWDNNRDQLEDSAAAGVRFHAGGPQGTKPKAEVIADILASIKERRA